MSTRSNKNISVIVLLFSLAFILAACGSIDGSKTITIKNTNQAIASTSLANTIQQMGAILATTSCPSSVSSTSHWNSIAGTQPGVNAVQSVTCANLEGNSSLQALVTVRYAGSSSVLDAFVYTNITNANPTEIFKIQNLAHGSASISSNTIVTSQVSGSSTVKHTYKWSASAGTFVRVS